MQRGRRRPRNDSSYRGRFFGWNKYEQKAQATYNRTMDDINLNYRGGNHRQINQYQGHKQYGTQQYRRNGYNNEPPSPNYRDTNFAYRREFFFAVYAAEMDTDGKSVHPRAMKGMKSQGTIQ